MASLAAVAAAAATSVALPRSFSFSGLRPTRAVSSIVAFPRFAVVSSHSRMVPCIRADAAAGKGEDAPVTDAAGEDTFTIIQKIIASQLDCEKSDITPDSKFVDLGADSLDTVEIMMALEEKFDIQLEQENADKIVTVGNATDLILEVLANQ
ncbi:uncharacterized protein [Physcomitrium patens]|uniref:Acyl carrier protein n=1 Tax=Physcomitrium patens TaxID=3218 RepID=A0A2K1JJ67_PHYPA|nr:acyl carrier protein, chloroplastic-like [Physcomitrium patens]PNR41591.1 hypothetical protein PHYPA_018994 [Physcomitrium patens]|eukprot:XP_024395756.1 acyl carrier protein, chloroplastic-like [Physcomitrella patens]